jgi:transcriptional regulator with XRE-family HTH domain
MRRCKKIPSRPDVCIAPLGLRWFMDIGSTLRDARLARGLSLRDVSASTKISVHALEAIECNDLAHLPSGFVVRGYLRAYASEVGLDAELIVKQYRTQPGSVAEGDDLQQLRMRYAGSERHHSDLIQVVVLVAVAALFYSLLPSRWTAETPADVVRERPSGIPVESALELPVANVRRSMPELVAIEIEIEPHGLCWVSAVSDGARVIHRLMQPGERAVIEAREQIVVRIGDAGAFAYSINGVAGRPIGAHGQAITVEITADNYQTFLSNPRPQHCT